MAQLFDQPTLTAHRANARVLQAGGPPFPCSSCAAHVLPPLKRGKKRASIPHAARGNTQLTYPFRLPFPPFSSNPRSHGGTPAHAFASKSINARNFAFGAAPGA